ncbi:hypothetical protein EZV62_020144 [Acer yangbiense]|uniref:RNase H type-1 domain-containing protein n=1 Tax=Acer yangbiense TaxID=1000413 RepID=A0A5C7HDP0_9ROSI|nr:hypothetical protein EZV62_020144 [Acer yangbiense]
MGKEAKELKAMFKHLDMDYMPRKYNSEADAQANQGAYLRGETFSSSIEMVKSKKINLDRLWCFLCRRVLDLWFYSPSKTICLCFLS